MANWCLNKIKISGDKENRRIVSQKINNYLQQDDIEIGLMESLVGREPTISEEDDNYLGWEDSNLNYWGTSYDVEENFIFEDNDDYIYLDVESAWTPPIEFCELLSIKYGVGVKLEYFEPGLNFGGIFEVNANGEILIYVEY